MKYITDIAQARVYYIISVLFSIVGRGHISKEHLGVKHLSFFLVLGKAAKTGPEAAANLTPWGKRQMEACTEEKMKQM